MAYKIHCEKCGHEFEVEKWHPGMSCPKCQASDTVPMTRLDGPAPTKNLSLADDKKVAASFSWKNSPVVAIVAIVVIAATWLGLGVWKFKKPKAMKVEVWAQCTECSKKVKKFTHEIPADCEKCGKKKTIYGSYECKGEKGKPCGNTFVFTPPPSPPGSDRSQKDWEKMSEEERDEAMVAEDELMIEYDEAQMEATKCLKCGSYNTVPVYTEEQNKRFKEMKEEYEKENR